MAGRRFAYTSSSRRRPIRPASGRAEPPSHFGPPTAPNSTASAARQASSVSDGSGSPTASIAAPPNACSSTESSSGSASRTATATAITSGPIPSPGRQTIRLATSELPLRQVEHVPDELGDALLRERTRVLAHETRDDLLLAAGVDDRDPVRLLVLEDPPGE